MNPIKFVIRLPFLAVFFAIKVITISLVYALALFPIMSFVCWVMVKNATVEEAARYWWANVRFMWYPLHSCGCDIASKDINAIRKSWRI